MIPTRAPRYAEYSAEFLSEIKRVTSNPPKINRNKMLATIAISTVVTPRRFRLTIWDPMTPDKTDASLGKRAPRTIGLIFEVVILKR